jgi:hypothetical protein
MAAGLADLAREVEGGLGEAGRLARAEPPRVATKQASMPSARARRTGSPASSASRVPSAWKSAARMLSFMPRPCETTEQMSMRASSAGSTSAAGRSV